MKLTKHSHERETVFYQKIPQFYTPKRDFALCLSFSFRHTCIKTLNAYANIPFGEYCKVLWPDGGKVSQETSPFKTQNLFLQL